MRKVQLLAPVVIILVILLASGCIPEFKSEFQTPSWNTELVLPIAKGEVPFGNLLDDTLLDLGIEPDSNNIFTYTFEQEGEPFSIDEIPIMSDTLAFDIGEIWSGQGAITIASGLPVASFNSPFINGTGSFSYVDVNGSYITSSLYQRMKLSPNTGNVMALTITLTEPMDYLKITLLDSLDQQVGNNYVELNNLIAGSHEASIDLTLCDIPNTLNFLVEYEATTTGTISIIPTLGNLGSSGTLEIVEIDLADPTSVMDNLNIELPTITIPDIDPFSGLKNPDTGEDLIQSITFESGRIDIIVTQQMADPNKLFPFDIDFQILYDEENIVETDSTTGDKFIDLTGRTFEAGHPLSGSVSVSFVSPMEYDVWDENLATVDKEVPYLYAIDLQMGQLKAQRIEGDISQLVSDWSFDLNEFDNSIQEITYPEDFPETIPGLKDVYITLGLNNNTSFSGSFDFTINVHDDISGTPAKDELGNDIKAAFTIDLPSRNADYEFRLHEQPDYQKLLDIINSKPQFLSLDAVVTLNSPDQDFYIEAGDYLEPYFSIELPLAMSIPPGGITIENQFEETITGESDLTMVSDFVNTATLHIGYENQSTFGVGARFHFSIPDGTPYTVDTIIYPGKLDSNNVVEPREDEITLTLNQELIDIISNPEGFNISADIIIPNDSDEDHSLVFKSTDTIKFTLWIDGKINVHVPDQI